MEIDLKIERVRNSIINSVNTSELPAGVMLYILEDISRQIGEVYKKSVEDSLREENDKKLENDKEKTEGEDE